MRGLLKLLKSNIIASVMVLVGGALIIFVTHLERTYGTQAILRTAVLLYRGSSPSLTRDMAAIRESAIIAGGASDDAAAADGDSRGQTLEILLWTSSTKDHTFSDEKINSRLKQCRYSNCEVTTDRTRLRHSKAVLFSTHQLSVYVDDLPPSKEPNQRWVFHSRRPPSDIDIGHEFDGLFNIVAYHHADSDVRTGYGYLMEKPVRDVTADVNVTDPARGKRHLVVWIGRLCSTAGLRELYVRELTKHVHVDVCGPCGNRTCAAGGDGRDEASSADALGAVISDYKFALIFETDLCADYVTRKLWLTLRQGTVPVVLGAADYLDFLPVGSFLDVRDFSSPKALAEHLLYLDTDADAYRQFFEWRKEFTVNLDLGVPCQLCAVLNKKDEAPEINIYDNFYYWLNRCTKPQDFYQNIARDVAASIEVDEAVSEDEDV